MDTSQWKEEEIGLYYYIARFYDPYLNHFSQPDTLVPDPYNASDWNRYNYTRFNPVTFKDPTGHWGCRPGLDGGSCGNRASNELEAEYKQASYENDWWEIKVSKKMFAAGKIYLNKFIDDPELAQYHQQNQTDEHRWAMTYAQYTHTWYEPEPEFYVSKLEEGKKKLDPWQILEGIAGLGSITPFMGLFTDSDDVNYVKYWSKATFGSREKSIDFHFNRHPGPWQTKQQYTQAAREFYVTNIDLAKPHPLKNGGIGVKITTANYYGIYTKQGQIVSFGINKR